MLIVVRTVRWKALMGPSVELPAMMSTWCAIQRPVEQA